MQTEAKPKRAASLQSLVTSSREASGLSSVWSISAAMSASTDWHGRSGGNAAGAGVDHAARLAGALFGAVLIAAGANQVIALNAGERRGAGGAEIAENFLGDDVNQAF